MADSSRASGIGRRRNGSWYTTNKEFCVDFPMQPAQQLQVMDVEMERPIPPRPPTTIIAQRDDNITDRNDNIQQAMSSFAKLTRQAAETMSIHSKFRSRRNLRRRQQRRSFRNRPTTTTIETRQTKNSRQTEPDLTGAKGETTGIKTREK